MTKPVNISDDRAGGTSHGSGNPPAIVCSTPFVPLEEPPASKSIEELAERVLAHGFKGNLDETCFILRHINYETFMQYASMVGDEKYVSNVHTLFMLDQRLKSVLMLWIGLFETEFRSLYANALAMECGAFAHRNQDNFKNEEHFNTFLADYSRELSYKLESGSKRIKRHVDQYGDVPIWTATEIIPFGTLSKLYRNTRSRTVRHAVSDVFGVRENTLISWMRTVSEVRNRCAHFSPLVCRPIVCKPQKIRGVDLDSSTPFYAALIIAQLTQPRDTSNQFSSMYSVGCFTDLCSSFMNIPQKILSIFGFPEDWKEIMARETGVIKKIDFGKGDEVVESFEFDNR